MRDRRSLPGTYRIRRILGKVRENSMLEDTHPEQLSLDLDFSQEPWNGFSPRYLMRLRNVEKYGTFVQAARQDAPGRTWSDPAQLCVSVGDSFGS